MSFRFQKRVKIAPGLRLNISKRGVSTSVGRSGASVTLGRSGLHGNVGIPGSGLSYRTKLNKKTGQPLNTWYQKDSKDISRTVSLVYDKQTYSLVFVDEDGQKVPTKVEQEIKREFSDDIQKFYKQKEKEINEQTSKLLDLHKQTVAQKTTDQLKQLAEATVNFSLALPDEKEIFEELKVEFADRLSIIEKLRLLFPTNRESFLEKIKDEALAQYNIELEQYKHSKELFEEERQQRLQQVDKVLQGDVNNMEFWIENFLTELDFPLETNVSFNILSAKAIYLDVDLPEIDQVPLTKASILKSGKLKVQKKSQKEKREHYAIMVGGTALYLCSYLFSLLPTCEEIIISGYTQVMNKATGHFDDQYIYSLKVDREKFYSLNISEVHPIAAFENFEPIVDVTKTYIFREIKPYEPVEE